MNKTFLSTQITSSEFVYFSAANSRCTFRWKPRNFLPPTTRARELSSSSSQNKMIWFGLFFLFGARASRAGEMRDSLWHSLLACLLPNHNNEKRELLDEDKKEIERNWKKKIELSQRGRRCLCKMILRALGCCCNRNKKISRLVEKLFLSINLRSFFLIVNFSFIKSFKVLKKFQSSKKIK